jgi:type II secretion system protein D
VNSPQNSKLKIVVAALLGAGIASAILIWRSPDPARAQQTGQPDPAAQTSPPIAPPESPSTNAPPVSAAAPGAPNPDQPPVTPPVPSEPSSPSPVTAAPAGAPPPGPPGPSDPSPAPSDPAASSDEIQLSFQNANIDNVVQWLAKTTGKSVLKHPRIQCQLTIVSSKKLPPREAVNLVYRALALEGFTTIETSQSISIVPEGQEPKLSPEMLSASQEETPEGRQRLIRVFPLKNIPPGELRDKVRGVLSEKASIEVDERGHQLIVTDYTDNIRLLGELIREIDVPSISETVIEIYPLKYSEADDLSLLISAVLNAQAGPLPSSASPSPSPRPPQPGMPMPMPSSPPPSSGAPPQPAATGSQQVRIWPDKTSNRLIVAAPRSKIPEVEKLIEILDTEKPADVSVRVLPLKHVSAEDLVKEIAPLYQKMGGRSLKEMIEITANTRANSLIILSSESNFKMIEKLVSALDTAEAQERVMQAFPLRNADAEETAKQLQELNQDQDSTSRYPFYFFSSSMQGQSRKKINVVADRRRNTVIVQAPPAAMENIARIIETLDEPVTDNNLAPKIYPLKYVSALDIEEVLNELFLKRQQQRTYWDFYGPSRTTTDQDAGRLYGKVRITSEPYSNSIIVTSNSPENLAAVEEILQQLDVPSQAGETTLRVGLKFAQAVSVASTINILFARGGAPPLRGAPQQPAPQDPRGQQQQASSTQRGFELEQEAKEDAYYPWLGGQQETPRGADGRSTTRPVSDLVGRVRVVPDRRSNSLLITANVHFLPQVMKLINELDAPTAQVLIEAKIIEISADFRDRLGVRWTPDGRIFDEEDMDNALLIRGGGTYQSSPLRSGVLDASLNLDLLIQFLRKNTGSKVLAEPQINIADNELGRLFVGAQVPFIDRSQSTDQGGLIQTFNYRDVGIILEVTPHINNSDEVALRIRAESSNIRAGQTLFGGAILDTRNFRTDLLVKSGQTVVLGGIIQSDEVDTLRKVPLLGDIPGLGWAFKKKDKVSREVELMVFLRTVITRTPEEAGELVEEIEKKAPRLKNWRETAPQNKLEAGSEE